MNKIFVSLIFILIALTGIACVSASSDFNETVDQDYIVSDVNETAVTIDEIAEDNDSAVLPVNDSTEDNDSIEIPSNDTTENQDSVEIPINNSTDEKDLKPVNTTSEKQSEPKKTRYILWFKMPEVDVHPINVSTGNKIDDAAIYYSAYYKAFKGLPKDRVSDLLDWTIALVYQSYTEKETIEIVTKIHSLVELNGVDPVQKQIAENLYYITVEKRFKDTYKYQWEFERKPYEIDSDNPFSPHNRSFPEDNPKA